MRYILNILILLLTFCVQGQISESWNLNIDTYTHNSSNYASKNPPIEIAEFSNNDKVILSQNGTLIKLDKQGEIIWRKEIKTCAQQRLIIDLNDNIIFSCGNDITKFNLNGEIIWQKDYSEIFGNKRMAFDALTADSNKIYLVGHFFRSINIFLISLDTNGQVLWQRKFEQGVKDEFSFLPPKQIILFNDRLFFLSHHYIKSNSFIYDTDLNGKNRNEIHLSYKAIKLKIYENSLFALGHLDNLNDKLIFTNLDVGFKFIEKYKYDLPRNYDYQKAIRYWATTPPTKEDFDKKFVTSYTINDFEFLNSQTLLIVGSSYGKPWISCVNLEKGIIWSWDQTDTRYFNFNNEYTEHNYSLISITQSEEKFLISGISEERDEHEDRFIKYVNLFVRKIELK